MQVHKVCIMLSCWSLLDGRWTECLHSRQLVVDHVAGLGLYHFWDWILATNSAQSLFVFCSASCSYPVSVQSHGVTVSSTQPDLKSLKESKSKDLKGTLEYPGLAWSHLRLVYELDKRKSSGGSVWQSLNIHAFHLNQAGERRHRRAATLIPKSYKCLPSVRFSMH